MEVWWLGVKLNVEVTVAKSKINSMIFSSLLVQAIPWPSIPHGRNFPVRVWLELEQFLLHREQAD